MDKEVLKKYKKAGEIAKKVLDYGERLVKEGKNVLEIAEAIEKKIAELGAKPAFPVNISINEIAAHFTPTLQDKIVIREEDYVKIDVGVHIDGYIADTARTIRLAGKDELIECSERMLEEALKVVKPGLPIREVGEIIEQVAKEFGFRPIRNLTGHGLERYDLHAGITIPNVKTDKQAVFEEGKAYAIEPFCTSGSGAVKDSERVLIFKFESEVPLRMPEARKILELAKNEWKGLPFARRWLENKFSPLKLELALKQLIDVKALYPFYILKEVSNANVTQSEHTIIVLDKPVVITK
jgi:methionyl aminopeptidase